MRRVGHMGSVFFMAAVSLALLPSVGVAQPEGPRDIPITCSLQALPTSDEDHPLGAGALESNLVCDVQTGGFFDEGVRDILENGFTNDLVFTALLRRAETNDLVAAVPVVFAQVFRLYTDVHYLSRAGEEGYIEHDTWEGVVQYLSQFRLSLGPSDRIGGGEFYVSLILEVNPLTEETLAEARNWIAQSQGGYRLFGDTVVGTYVSMLEGESETSTAEAHRITESDIFELGP